MKKEIVVTVSISMLLLWSPYILKGSERYSTAQEEGTGQPIQNPWIVDGNLTLRWDMFPEPEILFNCTPAIYINCSSVVLDLNGHTVASYSGGKAPGDDGVVIEGKHGVTMKNGNIAGFQIGIYVRDSTDVNIINNTLSEMANIGMSIESITGPTGDITISSNTISDIDKQGIWLKGINHADVTDNTVTRCASSGIMVYDSSNLTVSGNTLSDTAKGIYMDLCSGVVASNNTLLENSIGVELKNSNSSVYHNNFVDNTDQVEVSDSNATWNYSYRSIDRNYSYPCGGNYWSNYKGEDKLSGTNQNVSGSDGIIDQPYPVDEKDRDMYPLVNQWGATLKVFDIPYNISQAGVRWKVICPVALFSNSSIRDLDFDKTLGRISFHTGNGTSCRVIVVKELLYGAFNCSVDDVPTALNLTWDETYTFIDFSYSNKSHKVEITGERALRIVGDLDNNGIVDIIDIALAAKNFGKSTR